MNDEMAAGAKRSKLSIAEQAQTTILAKKASEERIRVESTLIKVFDDVAKKQAEGIKLNERQQKVIAEYSKGLEYAKNALKEAMDPLQVTIIAKDMEVLRDKIVLLYDKAAMAVTPLTEKLKTAGEFTDKLSDSILGAFSDVELQQLAETLNQANSELEQLGSLIDFISTKMEGMDNSSTLFENLSADIQTANQMLGRTVEELDLSTLSFDQLADRLKYFSDSLVSEVNPQQIVRINKEIEYTENQLKRIKNAGREGFDELGNKLIPDTAAKAKTLRSQLEGIMQQLAEMKLAGLGGTAEYDALINKASELRKALSNVRNELKKTSSETRGLDSLIGGATLLASSFNIAQGSVALMGVENETLQKTIVKLTSSISILQGLQQIQLELKRKESVANRLLTGSQGLYTLAVGTSTGALKIFRLALASTGIGLIVLAIGYLFANWDKLTKSIQLSGPAVEKWGRKIDKIKAIAYGVGNAILQFIIAPLKTLYILLTEGVEAAVESYVNSLNVIKNYNEGFANEIQDQANAAHLMKLETQKIALEREIEVRKAAGEKTISLERALHSTLLAIASTANEDKEQLLHDFNVWEAKTNKEAEAERQKNADKAKQAQDRAIQEKEKEKDRIKAFNKKLIDLEYNLQNSRIQLMNEGLEKEEAIENARFEKSVVTLFRELEDYKGTQKEKLELKISIDKQVQSLQAEHDGIMTNLYINHLNRIAEVKGESERFIFQVNKEAKKIELLDLDEKFAAINKKRKDAGLLEIDFAKEKAEGIASIEGKYQLQELKNREDIDIALVDLIQLNGRDLLAKEKIRESMRLQIMLDAAVDRLEILKSFGQKENKVIIAQTEAVIATIREKISQNNQDNHGGNFFKKLGLNVSDKEVQEIVSAYKEVFSKITSIFQESIDLQIQAKQKQIDVLTGQISAVKTELDKELESQKKGYASNVEAKRAELNALQLQKDKDIAKQEELQKRQQKLALVQVALNGIVQASQLELAISKLFESHAGIPFVGIALATAAGLAMLSTIVTIKKQIKSISNNTPQFRRGGVYSLEGPSHEQGGLGVYNEVTGKRVAEVEGGEGFFAISKQNKHLIPLFKQIHESGFDFFKEQNPVDKSEMNNMVLLAQKQDTEYSANDFDIDKSNVLRDIAYTSKQMLANAINKEQRIDMGEYYLIKLSPNHTRKIWKKKA